jgi:hypothetical protein
MYKKTVSTVARPLVLLTKNTTFLTDKARKELKQLDISFDEQESTAISIPQSDVLLSLSAIYMDPGIFLHIFIYTCTNT